MPPQRKSYDAIVIGAGHNGLTAAAYLSRAGFSTLVLERREIVGGCCVTEEIAPGCRASTTSYIASMLRPTIIRDLDLGAHGLRMVPCDPGLLVPFPDGQVVPWWADRERAVAEFRKLSPRDARTFVRVDDQLKKLARYLQPFFLEPPPDPARQGAEGWFELLARRKKISRNEGRRSRATGFVPHRKPRRFSRPELRVRENEDDVSGEQCIWQAWRTIRRRQRAGSAFPFAERRRWRNSRLLRARDWRNGSDHASAGFGVPQIGLRNSHCPRPSRKLPCAMAARGGVVLEDGSEISGRIILSNADPKRTFLGLVDERELPADFRHAIAGIKMDGPCAKVNFVLSEEPRVNGMPRRFQPASQRSLFTLVPSLEFAERCYDIAKFGEIPEELWVDCVVASNVDSTLAPPGKHIMTTFIQYVPYKLRQGTWDEKRELLGDRVVKKIAEYAPNVPNSIVARQVLTPLDLERTYGLTEGNIFHGDLSLEQLFFMRPVPGWAQYRTPIEGLVSLRRGRASRRRSDRRARLQRSASGAARLQTSGNDQDGAHA